jgi:hypothetical protein
VHQNTFFNQLKILRGIYYLEGIPKYTAEFKFPVKVTLVLYYMFQNQLHGQFDGYNIDFSTSEYDYVSDLIELHQIMIYIHRFNEPIFCYQYQILILHQFI